MKYVDGKEITSHMINGKSIETMWLNGHIIWQSIRSCYGGGMWIDNKPWLDDDAWKDN